MELSEQLERIQVLMEVKLSNEEIHGKYYGGVPKEVFDVIVEIDPDKKKDGSISKYSKWLLGLYMSKKLKVDELPKIKKYLNLHKKYQTKLKDKDINSLKTVFDLFAATSKFEGDEKLYQSKKQRERETKLEGASKLYEDDKWVVIWPKTLDASRLYASGTKWCTTSAAEFENYSETGKLYINIRKDKTDDTIKDNKKYQFHFPRGEFKSNKDKSVYNTEKSIKDEIGLTDGLINFYIKQVGTAAVEKYLLNPKKTK